MNLDPRDLSDFTYKRKMSQDQQQKRLVHEQLELVKAHAFYMKRAMDAKNLDETIERAILMLRVMKDNKLEPKNYYELYMSVCDELRELEDFFVTLQETGQITMADLYQKVQECVFVVPRMYLMFCVGGVYIQSKELPARDILKDMVDMVKGVQHPMRGLFLRHYLSEVSKDKLPDVGSPYEGAGGTMSDTYSFILQNFTETNRLWIRLQTHGNREAKKLREQERKELRMLVGTNLVRLSQLEGLQVLEYKESLLPRLLEEIVTCRDTLAQSYLMDCIVQVFPDEFHLSTLEMMLDACVQLKERVNVRCILNGIVGRLASHVEENNLDVIPSDIKGFPAMTDTVTRITESRSNISLVDAINLQSVLTDFALRCYGGNSKYVSHCLEACCNMLESSHPEGTELYAVRTTIEGLLGTVLSSLALRVMEIPYVARLMAYLEWDAWRGVASKLLQAVINSSSSLKSADEVAQLFRMIEPLLRDGDGKSALADDEDEDVSPQQAQSDVFKAEQMLVARVVHLMHHESTDEQFRMYGLAKKAFGKGGKQRMQHTFTPLVFAALGLARKVYATEVKRAAAQRPVAQADATVEGEAEAVAPAAAAVDLPPKPQFGSKKVLGMVLEVLTAMATSFGELSLNLFLNAALAADEFNYSAISYEFLKEALLTYESDVTNSKAQARVLNKIVGTLLMCRNLPAEDYEALITKTAQYANKLLRKPDQSRMITLCSHLFWPKAVGVDTETTVRYDDSDRVQECLEKALDIAAKHNLALFVDILEHYVYYYENGNPVIHARYISGLIALIHEQFDSSIDAATSAHFRNTIEYIKLKQGEEETSATFSDIVTEKKR